MESPQAKMKIFLGEFEVVQARGGSITITLGNNVHVTMHLAGLPATIKPGDTIPLFTYIPYNPEPLDAIFIGAPKQ